MSIPTSFPLASIRSPEAVCIADVLGEVADANRLKALGFCPGRTVQLIRSGDPLIVEVCGARLGISARLASAILVTGDDRQLSACA